MEREEYASLLGQIIANLQSLEFSLRAFLYNRAVQRDKHFPSNGTLDELNVGDKLPENALTDYSSLGKLIDRYNCLIKKKNPAHTIDLKIVELRDALAHGRISSTEPNRDFFLVKFNKPEKSFVKVAYSQKMTFKWLREQVNYVKAEVQKVIEVSESPKFNIANKK